ncbi:hypothetical protein ACQEU6_10265 [Spirillospora sp. CA-108201]
MSSVQSRPAAAGQWWRPGPPVRKTVTVVHVVASVALLGEVWGLVLLNLTATLTADRVLAHSAYRLMGVLVFGEASRSASPPWPPASRSPRAARGASRGTPGCSPSWCC